jgi:hypothetical protein
MRTAHGKQITINLGFAQVAKLVERAIPAGNPAPALDAKA